MNYININYSSIFQTCTPCRVDTTVSCDHQYRKDHGSCCPWSSAPQSERVRSHGNGIQFKIAAPFGDQDSSQEELTNLASASSSQEQCSVGRTESQLPKPPLVGGVEGETIDLVCNFVKLKLIYPSRSINEYEISFPFEVYDEQHRSQLLKSILNKVLLKKYPKVYNRQRTLWSPVKKKTKVLHGEYQMGGKAFRVGLTWICERKITDNVCDLMIMNVIVREIMTRGSQRADGTDERWPGFALPLQDHDGGILLDLDLSFNVVRGKTVHYIMSKLWEQANNYEKFKEYCSKYIIGMWVLDLCDDRTLIRIDNIDYASNPVNTDHEYDDGRKVSMREHYKTQYNLDVKDLCQPMLVCWDEKQESRDVQRYFISEFCRPMHFPGDGRTNILIMKELARITQLTPTKSNDDSIIKFCENVNKIKCCGKLLRDWGLRLVPSRGRILPPEKIYCGRNRVVQNPSARWGQALSSEHVLEAASVREWAILYTPEDAQQAITFSTKIVEISQRFGIDATAPQYKVIVKSEKPEDYCDRLLNLGRVRIVVIIFPTVGDNRYDTVIRLCNELRIPSQVIHSTTLQNPPRLDEALTRAVMQMNCKLGGIPWGVRMPSETSVMICGLVDLGDPNPRGPGLALALVCSRDKNATKWSSGCELMFVGPENSDKFKLLFAHCLQEWAQFNGQYPQQIIFYRADFGSSPLDNGQMKSEIFLLHSVCESLGQATDCKPTLTFIVVHTKHNMQYRVKKYDGSLGNPPPGTVVHHSVMNKNGEQCFYLVSSTDPEATNLGATLYVVLHNPGSMSMGLIESITFKSTHLHYDRSHTLQVPAPCTYALHLARQVVHHILPPRARNMTLYTL